MEKKTNKFVIPVLIALLFMNFFLLDKVINIDNRLNHLSSNVNEINNHISRTLDGLSHDISSKLEKQASIINDFYYEFGSIQNGNVDISLSVSPKSISNDDKFYFSYKIGDSDYSLMEAISSDGINYNSSINIPMKDTLNLDFVIDTGTTKKVEHLENLPAFEWQLLESFRVSTRGGYSYVNPNKSLSFTNATYGFEHFLKKKDENASLRDVSLILKHNDNIIKTYPMEEDPMETHDSYIYYLATIDDFTLKLDTNDTFEIYITAKDIRGFNIKANIDKFTIGNNGDIDSDFDHTENIIIY